MKKQIRGKLPVAVLFSGGKDSNMALYYALKNCRVKCLITLVSENPESYMFHTPNINLAEKQAKAIGLPIIIEKTKGVKEKELDDLERAIKKAIRKYKIRGVFTGALASVYQASRVQKICDKLGLACLNPLWHKDQFEFLNELVKLKFEVVIVGVAAEGLEDFLGRKIDSDFIKEIREVYEKFKINPAGEGGEYETFVLNAPFFKKKLRIEKSHVIGEGLSKILVIDEIK
jgi:ABC transporter with metal-binding/Fe-S-binding domain ATP-binding protein